MIATRALGGGGRQVSEIGYGAWAIGGLGYGDVPRVDAVAAVETYLAAGGWNIDTARGYGVSEIIIGDVLAGSGMGEEVFVATKSGSRIPAMIRADLETSLFCLRRPYADLYYVHVPPPDFDALRRMLDVYQQLKDSGRVRLIGLSQRGEAGAEAIGDCRRYIADGRADVLQLPYSMARPGMAAIFEEAARHGLGVIARMNLEGGLLTGKYAPGHDWPDKENDWRAHRPREAIDRLLGIVRDIQARFVRPPYESLSQVALAWCLADAGISAIIPGGKNAAHVRANVSVADLPPMPAALRAELTAACSELAGLLAWRLS